MFSPRSRTASIAYRRAGKAERAGEALGGANCQMFELSDQASRARLGIAKGFGDGVNGHRRKFRVNELFERGRGGFLRKMLCKQGTRSLRSLSRCALV